MTSYVTSYVAPCVTLAVLALVGWAVAAVWATRTGSEEAPLAGGSGPAARLDLNSAGAAELEALPGVGPVLSRRIVEERERAGGFRSVDDLLRVRGVTRPLIERIRPSVRVGETGETGETGGTGDGSR